MSIGYERFVEEKAFVHEVSGGEKQKEDVRGLVRAVDVMVGRYGRLSVQFGKPLTLGGRAARDRPAREARGPRVDDAGEAARGHHAARRTA